MDPYSLNNPGFLNLLTSQSSPGIDVDSPEVLNFTAQTPQQPKVVQRRQWTQAEDEVLMSAWLNTSKDPIIGNQQRLGSFWSRITSYYNASPEVNGSAPRELSQVKQRWRKVNELVSKFVGCYEAAVRTQSSDNDVMSTAHAIFLNDCKVGLNLEHAWRILRYNQKWLSSSLVKEGGKEKAKEPAEAVSEDVEAEARPIGVKAAKAAKTAKRKTNGNEGAMSELREISRQKILSGLLAKSHTELSELEVTLKNKLMEEML